MADMRRACRDLRGVNMLRLIHATRVCTPARAHMRSGEITIARCAGTRKGVGYIAYGRARGREDRLGQTTCRGCGQREWTARRSGANRSRVIHMQDEKHTKWRWMVGARRAPVGAQAVGMYLGAAVIHNTDMGGVWKGLTHDRCLSPTRAN